MTESLPEALTEVAQATVKAGAWERDREAWNLPRAVVATPSTTAGRPLDWQAFSAAFYPDSRRHNLAAIIAYGEYKRTGTEPAASGDSRPLSANGAVGAWEDDGGAPA
jgi:hypothetical protein